MDLKNTLPSKKTPKRTPFTVEDCERLVQEFQDCPCNNHMDKLIAELSDALEVILWCEQLKKRILKKSKNRMAAYRQRMTKNFVQSIPENTMNQNLDSKSIPNTDDFFLESEPNENLEFSTVSPYPLELGDSEWSRGSQDGYDGDSEFCDNNSPV